jgi:hypothetical protein
MILGLLSRRRNENATLGAGYGGRGDRNEGDVGRVQRHGPVGYVDADRVKAPRTTALGSEAVRRSW